MTVDSSEPALATTKRKFNRLLDNLTASASTSSLASTLQESNASTASLNIDPATPPPKRSRVSDVSASMERPRNVSGNERIKDLQTKLFTPRAETNRFAGAGLRSVGAAKASATPTTPRKTPNFAPYSQEQFLARLKTFADVKKWTNKPDAIGEVEWAKRGWMCDTWNTVACKGGCEQRVVVKLRPKRKDAAGKEIEMSEDLGVDIDEGLVEKYYELVLEGHHEDCLWKKAGCKDEIYHIPIPNRSKSSAELLDRYESFKAISSDLPLLENITYPNPPVSDVLARIPSSFWGTHDIPTSTSNIVAFTFALFGWSGVTESKIALATCNHCFQRIGLWLSNDARLKEMSTKLSVPIESLRLNLLESHREHCPWKNPDTQGNTKNGPIENMAAWETLEFMLMGKKKDVVKAVAESGDTEATTREGSFDVGRESLDIRRASVASGKKGDESEGRWQKFKAKLRRTASKKSLKSSRSVKSVKSVGGEKEKENEKEGRKKA